MYKPIITCFITCLIGCASKLHQATDQSYNGIPFINFCDLPNHEDELVYTKAIYSGIDEYWALNAGKKCNPKINVELDYREGTPIPKQYQPLFDSVYSKYWNSFLSIEATGKYESKNPKGYGHLGSNKARFIIKDYVKIKLVKK